MISLRSRLIDMMSKNVPRGGILFQWNLSKWLLDNVDSDDRVLLNALPTAIGQKNTTLWFVEVMTEADMLRYERKAELH